MKCAVVVGIFAVLIGGSVNATDTKLESNVMPEMRARVFAVTPEQLGLKKQTYPHEVWGVLMETGFEGGGAYSLVVLADGTTSIYFSTGAGIIGAGQHDSVRSAAQTLLAGANRYDASTTAVSSYPLPPPGFVTFYFLSRRGVLSYTAAEDRLGSGGDALSSLFLAGHQVITEVRKTEENRRGSGTQ